MFRWEAPYLRNEKGKVMDIQGGKDNQNTNIIVWNKHGGLNQQWDLLYADEWKGDPKKGELNKEYGMYVERDFYISTSMNSHRYLDLINNRNFVIKTPNGRNTQKWYFHQESLTIRTRLNNQSWDIKSAGKTNNMQVWSTNSGWFQVFKFVSTDYKTGMFMNTRNNKVLDVSGGKDAEGQSVIVWGKHGKVNQQWNIIYVDKAKPIQDEGLMKDFGFVCDKPFYFRSRLPMRRVAEAIGANNISIKRWRKNTTAQQFFFDCTSKTIRS
jgi:hypothetical protein